MVNDGTFCKFNLTLLEEFCFILLLLYLSLTYSERLPLKNLILFMYRKTNLKRILHSALDTTTLTYIAMIFSIQNSNQSQMSDVNSNLWRASTFLIIFLCSPASTFSFFFTYFCKIQLPWKSRLVVSDSFCTPCVYQEIVFWLV